MNNSSNKNQTTSGKDNFQDALDRARESLGVKKVFDLEMSGLTDTQKSIRGKNNYRPSGISNGEDQHWPTQNPNEGKIEEDYRDNDDYKL